MAHQTGAYPGFCSIKRLGIFLPPLDGMPVHRLFIGMLFLALYLVAEFRDPEGAPSGAPYQ